VGGSLWTKEPTKMGKKEGKKQLMVVEDKNL
jgi:hypothetical protein